MSNAMIEVVIDSIRVSLMSQQRIVILREKNAERYLPIWIGIYEAESITIALQEVEVARPLTHDLVKNIFKELNARILRVEVIALRDDTFYGNIVIEVNGQTLNIDSRPSDAVALAVRAHVPILVAASVMETAGIIPEEDLQDSEQPAPLARRESAPKEQEEADERLSVFDDFLTRLDLTDEEGDEDDDEGSASAAGSGTPDEN
jgi:bifunctional DNase/RNase